MSIDSWTRKLVVGNTYKSEEIKSIGAGGENIYPSDHCYNKMNDGNIKNSRRYSHAFDNPIFVPLFEYIVNDEYKYLGGKALYSGKCIHTHKNGSKTVYGEWKNGEFFHTDKEGGNNIAKIPTKINTKPPVKKTAQNAVFVEIIPKNSTNSIAEADVSKYFKSGLSSVKTGDYDKAIANFTEAIKCDPKYAGGYCCRADVYYQKGYYDDAIVDYTQAIKLDSEYAWAYFGCGASRYKKGDYNGAVSNLKYSINLNPNNKDAYHFRGLAYYYLGEYERARADWTNVVQLDPNASEAKENLKVLQNLVKN